MIGTIDVNIQAARPDFPLTPLKAFLNSPSSIRVRNVPKKIGKWEVTSVTISANYPDNTTKSAACVLTAGIWVGTLAGCAAVGTSGLGYSVIASGTDENGAAVSGYVLGKGEVEIMPTDGTIVIGETAYYIHLLDAVPTNPHKGDLVKVDGTWKFWNGTAWEVFGGGGGGGIEEYANREVFPATGVSGVLYCAKDTGKLYRWATELSPAAYAEVSPSADVSGKADKVANATSGNFAGLDANGNLTDSGKKAADFDAAGAAATVETKVSIKPWVASTAYSVNDFTTNGGFIFVCTENHTSGESFDETEAAKWTKCARAATTLSGYGITDASVSQDQQSYLITLTIGNKTVQFFSGPNTYVSNVKGVRSVIGANGNGLVISGGSNGSATNSRIYTYDMKVLADDTDYYSASSPYAVGDFCNYRGYLYVCNTAIGSGGEEWNATHWTAMPNVSSLFSGANSSLVGAIDGELKADTSSLTGAASGSVLYRIGTLESTIGTINSALDALNGEVA